MNVIWKDLMAPGHGIPPRIPSVVGIPILRSYDRGGYKVSDENGPRNKGLQTAFLALELARRIAELAIAILTFRMLF